MQITVVGGGFGGVKAALELAKNKRARVTLISDKAYFQYYPALYGTATGRSHLQSWVPLGQIFTHTDNVNVVIDTVTHIDKEARTLKAESGTTYEYQTLILALGSTTSFFGIKGLDDYAYGIKSYEEIRRLQQHLLEGFSKPNAADSHFLVIGGGATGVELVSALGTYLKRLRKHYKQPNPRTTISLIEAAPRILPRMSEKASRRVMKRLEKLGIHVKTNQRVEEETADTLVLNGRPIKSHTVIWTAGVTNSPFFAANADQFEISPKGKIVVDEYLRSSPHVYVIGDNAATLHSGLAQTALHDGVFVARHILKKSTKKYHPKLPPIVIPVGEKWAIFEYRWLCWTGWAGAVIRHAADFMGYRDILPLGQALGLWHAQSVKRDAVFYANLDSLKKELASK